jgi:hypothetical protein
MIDETNKVYSFTAFTCSNSCKMVYYQSSSSTSISPLA